MKISILYISGFFSVIIKGTTPRPAANNATSLTEAIPQDEPQSKEYNIRDIILLSTRSEDVRFYAFAKTG
jgi:hypothetical protein